MLCGAEYIFGKVVTTLSTFVISGIITYSVNKGIHCIHKYSCKRVSTAASDLISCNCEFTKDHQSGL